MPKVFVGIDVEGAVVVEERMHDRLLRLHVIGRQTLEVEAAQIEPAARPLPGQIDRRGGLAEEIVLQQAVVLLVVLQEIAVAERRDVPAELPIVVDLEFAVALHRAAPALVARARAAAMAKALGSPTCVPSARMTIAAVLEAAGGTRADRNGPCRVKHGRRDRQIIIGRERPIIGNADAVADAASDR